MNDSASAIADGGAASGGNGGANGGAAAGTRRTGPLVLAAMGVVFGDICTSPLYAMRESFEGHHPMAVSVPHVYGILSLIAWSLIVIVTAKYVLLTMRADNDGEGGSLALLALITRLSGTGARRSKLYVVLGVCATSLFFGDSIVTPAISVLSAVEGLQVVSPALEPAVLPLAVLILVALFSIQSRGTALMGRLFGPVIGLWCAVLVVLGIGGIVQHPSVLEAFGPQHAFRFLVTEPGTAFLALGAVVLVVTGAEAVYADMGQFGKRPIRLAWLCVVMPSLAINYAGQAALVIERPEAISSPFFLLAPEWARLPLVVLAACATVIASQAVISGAFSIAAQAIRLGFLPRLRIVHTSAHESGQVYLPGINLLLMFLVLLLVLEFGSSSDLAAAYGIAVTGTMLIDTVLLSIVMLGLWRWNRLAVGVVIGTFALFEATYFASNLLKLFDGGWVPVLIAAFAFTLITTWSRGRALLRARLEADRVTWDVLFAGGEDAIRRVPGTAVFMTRAIGGVPTTLLHNLKHNKVLHERVLVLTVRTLGTPRSAPTERCRATERGHGITEIELRFGFMERSDLPRALRACGAVPELELMDTTWFIGRQTVRPATVPQLRPWRRRLFAWMLRSGAPVAEFYRLPSNRVVEMGSQVRL